MAEMSVIWLRVAAALYSLGLVHAILTLIRRREHLFRPALGALGLGSLFHLVSIVEEGLSSHRVPIANFYQTLSMGAFLVVVLYLFVHWRYKKVDGLGIFIFPLVFVATMVATLETPVGAWSSPIVRDAWLTVHIVLVLLGYAALLFAAAASLLYLFQERELKAKKPRRFYYRLPALGTLDDLISKTMSLGFVLITVSVLAGCTWAFIELGTGWISHPKIAISFFTWGVYLVLVFLRTTAGWRGRKAAIMTVTVLGFAVITWGTHSGLGSILFNQ
jgi:ABC-type uncharacterized transport system permease subunit